MPDKAQWTILTYIAAHNNLGNFGLQSLKQIINVGSTHEAMHGVLFDGPRDGRRYLIGDAGLVLEQTPLKDFDSGDPNRLIETARFVFGRYPAEHYGLVLWSHGTGWQPEEIERVAKQVRGDEEVDKVESHDRAATPGSFALFRSTLKTIVSQPSWAERAILFDDGTGHSLDTLELGRVTREVRQAINQPLDLVGMDACLMATLEVAYQLKETTRFLVASEELVPGHSWPYDLIYGALRTKPDHSPRDLADRIVRDYVGYYSQHPPSAGDVTKIAVDLSKVEPVAHSTKALAEALLANMGEVKQHLADAQNETQAIETANQRREDSKFKFHLWDLYSVSNHLAKHCSNATVKTTADELCKTFQTCGFVVREGHYGAWFDGTGGMSVYLIPPKKGRKRHIASSYSEVAFAKGTLGIRCSTPISCEPSQRYSPRRHVMEFQDFDVFVTDVHEELADDRTIARFRVHVKDVETEGVETTLDASALLDQLDDWTSLRPTWSEVISVGKLLGDALFPTGRIRESLLESLVKPRRRESRLRITLNMGSLSKYPWEFAVFPSEKGETTQHDILALNSQVSLIRLIDLSPLGTSSLKPAALPLLMVMAMSNPKGTPKQRLDREKQVIQQSIGQSERVHVTYVDKARSDDYLAGLKQADLFHFAGHGSFAELPTAGEVSGKGVIWLDDPGNTAVSVDAPTLALKLADAEVRVAVLGACLTAKHDDIHVWTSIATSLLKAGIGAVVAMQYAVEDPTAIEFARAFYESLAMGFPIDQAVTKGRLAICEKGDARGIGTPVLYMRKSDGILFPNLTNDPALAAEREKTHVVVKLSAGLVQGELTGIDVITMKGGEAESTVNVDHVAAGGKVTSFKAGTLSGGNVNVDTTIKTVGKGGNVVGAEITSLG